MPEPSRPHRRLVIVLPAAAADRLIALAARELRDPRDQAKLIVLRALEIDGDRNPPAAVKT